MNWRNPPVRVTHLPTGLSATSRCYRSVRDCVAAAEAMVRAMVARRLADPSWVPLDGRGPVIRTYDLAPPKAFHFAGPVVRDVASRAVVEVDARDLFDGGTTLERLMVARRKAMETPDTTSGV